MTHKSRVDVWMWPLLPLPLIGGGVALAAGIASGEATSIWIGAGSLVLYLAIMAGLVLPLRYLVHDDRLEIRAGLQRIVVPWDRLIRVTRSSNPLSSPALSLRRLNVEYRKPSGKETHVLISPVDRDAFVQDLAAASLGHVVESGELTVRA